MPLHILSPNAFERARTHSTHFAHTVHGRSHRHILRPMHLKEHVYTLYAFCAHSALEESQLCCQVASPLHKDSNAHTRAHTHAHARAHTHTCTHMHTHAHTRTRTLYRVILTLIRPSGEVCAFRYFFQYTLHKETHPC